MRIGLLAQPLAHFHPARNTAQDKQAAFDCVGAVSLAAKSNVLNVRLANV